MAKSLSIFLFFSFSFGLITQGEVQESVTGQASLSQLTKGFLSSSIMQSFVSPQYPPTEADSCSHTLQLEFICIFMDMKKYFIGVV